jgi:tetratricopeptide (TPR) repeat protein
MAYLHACNSQSNSGHMQAAIELCNRAIAADPGAWQAWQLKAQAESILGNQNDALASWDHGIQTAREVMASGRDTERAKTGLGQMLSSEGNFYVQLKHFEEAVPLFTEAARVSANPASPLFNLCATEYNLNRLEAALAACDQAIAANPEMADAYFVKASILFGKGRSEQGKYQTPEGTSEALGKYLELDPEGNHANDARDMLKKIGSDVPFKSK